MGIQTTYNWGQTNSALADIANSIAVTDGLIRTRGKVIEDFNSITPWTGTNCTPVLDTAHVRPGSKAAVKVVNTAAGTQAKIDRVISMALASMTSINIWAYIVDITKVTNITVYFTSAAWTKWYSVTFDAPTQRQLKQGWNLIAIPKANFITGNGDSWDNTMVKFRLVVTPVAASVAEVTFDMMIKDQASKPCLVLTFDDGYKVVQTGAFPLMEALGIKGTCWVAPSLVNGVDVNYMRLADLTALANAGWLISNHTLSHTNLSTLTTDAEIAAEIQGGIDFLNANGFSKGSQFLGYPLGGYNDNVIRVAQSLGIKSARSILQRYEGNPVENLLTVGEWPIAAATSTAGFSAKIDEAIQSGTSIITMIHADFNATVLGEILTYASTRIECMTYDQWYEQVVGIQKFYDKF
jgi:peptidoglycan/xylan/chitin deacetylase (PgdA/CDA1 family)